MTTRFLPLMSQFKLQSLTGWWPALVVLVVLAGLSSVGQAQESGDNGEGPPIGERPYQIRAWFAFDPAARLGQHQQQSVIDDWQVLVQRFVGEPWDVQVADGPGPLQGLSPDEVEAEALRPLLEDADKGWLIRVEPAGSGAGYILRSREYDVLTRRFGPLYEQEAPYPRDLPRSVFELTQRMFAPVAEIEQTEGTVLLQVQGASLRASNNVGRVVDSSVIFQPHWLFLNPEDRSVDNVRAVPFTYLQVNAVEGAQARCQVVSGLRRPLPSRVLGRYRLVALGRTPADLPTKFRFQTVDDDPPKPVAGYVLTAKGLDDPVAEEVGTTGRDGRITLPPRFDDELVVLRLLAAGVEPLREFPVLPGITAEERTIPVEPRPLAVTLEFRLQALQDQIVDLIAQRGRLQTLLEARASGQDWDSVERLLDQFRQLTNRSTIEQRLEAIKQQADQQQQDTGQPVLTRTAQAKITEVESLIQRYLTEDVLSAYSDALEQARNQGQEAEAEAASDQQRTESGLRRRQPRGRGQ